jgi:hypothetical protein
MVIDYLKIGACGTEMGTRGSLPPLVNPSLGGTGFFITYLIID